MMAIDGAFALPEAAILKVPEKLHPRVIAHVHGGDLFVAAGAGSSPLTLVAFRHGGAQEVRTYPYREDSEENRADRRARERAGEFDPLQDQISRDPNGIPRQLVSIGDALVLVRLWSGHALIDPATLAIETVPRSVVQHLHPAGPGQIVVGACARFSAQEAVQLFWLYEAARLREPLVRSYTRLSAYPKQRIADGTPFPEEEAEIPLAAGIARLWGTKAYSWNDMHVASAVAWRGKLFALTLALYRSGSMDHSLTRFDFASRKIDRFVLLAANDKTLRASFAPSPAGLIAFADEAVLLIDPETLAVVDRAPLPKGIRLVGSDDARLILHHKRANTLFVVRNTALAPPLGPWLAALQDEIKSLLQLSRAAAKRRGT